MMTLTQALQWLPGARLVGDGATPIQRVHTDTRTLQPGDLFVALKGERFDANDFLADALAQGATAVLAHRGMVPAGASGIEVDDTRMALGQLAVGWRSQFSLPLIAVTGSNGKTTVTQMIASILRAWQGDAALATQGNLNNDIGVPLTLLRLRASHRVAVVELGMNHPGEIAYLANIRAQRGAGQQRAARAPWSSWHVEAVARENGSVLSALPAVGTAVFPADDDYTPVWAALAGGRACLSFGGPSADISLAGTEWGRGIGRWACKRLPGRWRFPCTSPAATTCATRWRPLPVRWPRARRWMRSGAGWRALRPSRAARALSPSRWASAH
jgi:UDP-N-acetylmuramoyl-tripeptide--D-alanyl-D-alanine ligase